MIQRLWISLNILIVVISFVYIWFFRPHDGYLVVTGQFLAQLAILLFLININMYFIFLVIRKTSQRNIKIRLAKFSRFMMKWHIIIAVTATIIIAGHAWINLLKIGPIIGYAHLKMLSGYGAIFLLTATLFAGFLRHKKASGFRRKFHLTTAMFFFIMFLIHMFTLI